MLLCVKIFFGYRQHDNVTGMLLELVFYMPDAIPNALKANSLINYLINTQAVIVSYHN